MIIEMINNSELENIKVKTFGYGDCFVEHGSVEELENIYNLSKEKIAEILKNTRLD